MKILSRTTIFLILLLAFGLLLRLHGLAGKSFATDENWTLRFTQQIIEGTFFETVGSHAHTFFFYGLLVPFWLVSGHSVFVLRMLMILFGMASIFFIFSFVRRLFDERFALLCTLLLIFSPFHILYSQLLRPYIFLMFLFSLSLFLLNEYCRTKKTIVAITLTATYIIAFYSHVLSALFVITQLFYLIFLKIFLKENIPPKHLVAMITICCASWLLWVPVFLKQFTFNITNGAIVTLSTIKAEYIPYTFYKYAVGLDVSSALNSGRWWVLIFAFFLGLSAFWGSYSLFKESRYNFAFLLANLFGPLILLAILGIFFPVYSFRYISYVAPLFLIFVAKGFDTIKSKPLKWALILVTIILWQVILDYYWSIFTYPKWDIHFAA